MSYILDRARAGRARLAAADRRRRGEVPASRSSSAVRRWPRARPCWRATASPSARRSCRRQPAGGDPARHARQAAAGRGGAASSISETQRVAAAGPAWGCCWSAGRPSSPATSATTARRRSRSATANAGTSPATWPRSTPTASCTFRGRLKRFLKAGGEMISLPALEEPFERLYPPTPGRAARGGRGRRDDGGRRIVLFTTEADHAAGGQRPAAGRGLSAA